jgi:predicted MFS family arabinose efflux permease
MSSYAGSVFSVRSFSLFYAGQTLSFVGDGLRLIYIPLLVYHLTGSALSIGVTYALELGPFMLFGLVGGSLGDRVDRRRLMIACDFVRLTILALFAVAYVFGFLTLGMLYAGIAAISIAAAIFVGAQASSIPYLVGKERVTKAVSMLLAAEQTSQMILPPIGAALLTAIGLLPLLAINAFTYLCSQISIAIVPSFGPDQPGRLPSPRNIMGDIRLGFRFLFADAAMRTVASNSFILNFFGFMFAAVQIPYLKSDFQASDTMVGLAFGVGGCGALIGSWFAGHVPKEWKFGRMMIVAYALDGILFLPVMFTHNLGVMILFNALTYGVVLFEIAQIVGWRIRITPEEMVGRATSAARLIALLGTVPGAILGGWLGDHEGPRFVAILSGFGYLAMALLIGLYPVMRRESR